jgi:hypothetical protein
MFIDKALVLFCAMALVNADEPCTAINNVFTVKINLFAGELGTYRKIARM